MACPLSVIILTLNEEDALAAAFESVRWADEVLVVDAESTDATLAVARQLGASIRIKPFEDFSRQRNWAIGEARHDWVLMLDADERLSPALQEEIQRLLQTPPACAAFRIRRVNYFMGRKIRYSGWQGDRVIRLFNRSSGTYAPKTVHEKFVTDGEVQALKHPLLHYTYKSIASYLEKHDSYTTAAASEIAASGKDITPYHLLVKPCFHFFRAYLFKLGFLDGKQGIVIAWLGSYSVFMRNLKAWRLQQGEKIHQKP